MKRSIWKKAVCVLLCAAALFALASCKQKIVADWVAQDHSPAEQPPKELLERIVTDFAANKERETGKKLTADWFVQAYYGVYSGAVPVMMDAPFVAYPTIETIVEVAGYRFEYGNTNTMKVWKNGTFYSLKEAYEQGVLTAEQIGTLADIDRERTFLFFDSPQNG